MTGQSANGMLKYYQVLSGQAIREHITRKDDSGESALSLRVF